MELNKYIEHTNLDARATLKDIETLCEEAKKYHFETVCVNPFYVPLAKELLNGSNVGIATVIGYPLGMNTIQTKEYEAIDAINNGADEIDMVINVGCVKNKDYDLIRKEIETVRDSIDGHPLKVIIEECNLEEDEIIKLTEVCNETFVNFIEIVPNFETKGSIVEVVEFLNQHKGEILEIKASGEIQTEEEAIKMIEAGVTRMGTSHGVEIVTAKKCCGEKEACNCSNKCEHEHCHCEED